MTTKTLMLFGLVFLFNLAMTYGFALLGEPRSVWFWRLMGVEV